MVFTLASLEAGVRIPSLGIHMKPVIPTTLLRQIQIIPYFEQGLIWVRTESSWDRSQRSHDAFDMSESYEQIRRSSWEGPGAAWYRSSSPVATMIFIIIGSRLNPRRVRREFGRLYGYRILVPRL